MASPTSPPTSLLLSIDEQHVSRIFAKKKRFELRKRVTNRPFSRVYLLQTKGTGIVGWFEPKRVIRASIPDLWREVGVAAAPKRRFDAYFKGFGKGCAIEIGRLRRFATPISLEALRRAYPRFRSPLSSDPISAGSPLYDFLDRNRELDDKVSQLSIGLRRLSKKQERTFRELVMKEISKNYEEIDGSFVDTILKSHESGYDPVGFFTESKEALEIRGHRNRLLGFTTVTYKKGGSAKTGPTILLPEHRGRGVGVKLRRLVEHRILARGFRKIYCTAPSTSGETVRYLLKSGYKVEAHLHQQYHSAHDELVFGRMILEDNPEMFLEAKRRGAHSARVVRPEQLKDLEAAREGVASLLKAAWFPFDDSGADRIAEEVFADEPGPSKPKRACLLVSGEEVVGLTILLPKRGGSIKTLLISATNHGPSIERLMARTAEHAVEMGGRRLYYLHPVGDAKTVGLLREAGYLPEGLLRAPYAPGQDLVVYANRLRSAGDGLGEPHGGEGLA